MPELLLVLLCLGFFLLLFQLLTSLSLHFGLMACLFFLLSKLLALLLLQPLPF